MGKTAFFWWILVTVCHTFNIQAIMAPLKSAEQHNGEGFGKPGLSDAIVLQDGYSRARLLCKPCKL